tara:strand:+ start:2273 stop:2830 length:558 start_codon:yes stop_codon:yes gene_type:complete
MIEEEEEKVVTIQAINSSVYFYSEISRDSVFKLITILKEVEQKVLKMAVDFPDYEPTITLYIHSEGGDIFAGFSAMDHIRNCRVPVTTIADGQCASAATFILLSGSKRIVYRHAMVLIHQISINGFWGNFQELKKEFENNEKFMNILKKFYKENTKIPAKTMNELMNHDIYLTAEDCSKYGIAYP